MNDLTNKQYAIVGVRLASKVLDIPPDVIEVVFKSKEYFKNPDMIGIFEKEVYRIIFNETLIIDASPEEIMITAFHETRHAYQCMVCELSMLDSEPIDRIVKWREELDNSIQPKGIVNEDFKYLNQDIEIDAIAFSRFMLKKLIGVTINISDIIKEKVLNRTQEIKDKYKNKFEN